MFDANFNVTAILVLPLLAFVIGFIYYGPLFGNRWIELTGITPEKARQNIFTSYLGAYITTFVMAYVLALFISALDITTFNDGAKLGFWMWFGFSASSRLTDAIFEQTNKQLFAINAVYHLLNAVVIGGLLAIWI